MVLVLRFRRLPSVSVVVSHNCLVALRIRLLLRIADSSQLMLSGGAELIEQIEISGLAILTRLLAGIVFEDFLFELCPLIVFDAFRSGILNLLSFLVLDLDGLRLGSVFDCFLIEILDSLPTVSLRKLRRFSTFVRPLLLLRSYS